MIAPLRMMVEQLTDPPHLAGQHVVNLYGPNDTPICWCGPYAIKERDECINLFRDAGWFKRNGLELTE